MVLSPLRSGQSRESVLCVGVKIPARIRFQHPDGTTHCIEDCLVENLTPERCRVNIPGLEVGELAEGQAISLLMRDPLPVSVHVRVQASCEDFGLWGVGLDVAFLQPSADVREAISAFLAKKQDEIESFNRSVSQRRLRRSRQRMILLVGGAFLLGIALTLMCAYVYTYTGVAVESHLQQSTAEPVKINAVAQEALEVARTLTPEERKEIIHELSDEERQMIRDSFREK